MIGRILLATLALAAVPQPALAAKKNICTSAVGRTTIKSDGKTLQKLHSGQYYAYRHPGGTWTFCNSKGTAKSAFKTFNFDFNNQKNTGVSLLSQPGRCLALQLRPQAGGYPSVPAIDMRAGKGFSAAVNQIDFTAPGARIVKTALSSTCLLGTAYVSVAGARIIQLNPIIGPNVIQDAITLGAQSTDADLKAFSLSGDDVAWTDAGVKQSKHYTGLPR